MYIKVIIYKSHIYIFVLPYLSVPLEIDMLTREHFNRWYKLGPYFLSLISFEIPFQVCYSSTWDHKVIEIYKSPPRKMASQLLPCFCH